jgi:hypothetical protein
VLKTSADDADFTLQNIPKGRETQSNWTVNALGGALASLQLDDVAPADTIDFSDASLLKVLTADGLQIDAELKAVEDKRWIKLTASSHAPQPEAAGESPQQPLKEGEEGAADDVEDTSTENEAPSAAQRADEINRRVAGWAYQVPEYKFSVMTRKLDDLLKPKEDD